MIHSSWSLVLLSHILVILRWLNPSHCNCNCHSMLEFQGRSWNISFWVFEFTSAPRYKSTKYQLPNKFQSSFQWVIDWGRSSELRGFEEATSSHEEAHLPGTCYSARAMQQVICRPHAFNEQNRASLPVICVFLPFVLLYLTQRIPAWTIKCWYFHTKRY